MDATDSPSDAPRRSGARPWILMAVVAAALLVYLAIVNLSRRDDAGTSGPAIGRKLVYLRLEPLTGGGQGVSLEDLQGSVTVLNFWGTWCPPCIREFPHLVELAKHFADHEDLRYYPVSCGGQGDDARLEELRGATEAFLQTRGVDLPTYADPSASTRRALVVSLELGQFAYPTTLVLDRQGTIRGLWIGYEPHYVEQMKSLVEQLLTPVDARSTLLRPRRDVRLGQRAGIRPGRAL